MTGRSSVSAVSHAPERAVKARGVRTALKRWHVLHRRSFPWRRTRAPFSVLLAEFMLRRTRAQQVVPVYEKLLAVGRTPRRLAEAGAAYSASLLGPLGLRWRAKQLGELADALRHTHHGNVPRRRAELMALPGVGDYVAAAVRAFAFNLPDVLVDTNTVRVAGRVFGFGYGPESRRRHDVRGAVALLHSKARPRESAEALLDFAALVCTARKPRCEECPISDMCAFFLSRGRQQGRTPDMAPVRSRPTPRSVRSERHRRRPRARRT
ncbi:MAG: DNA-binding protein [Chloroflexi bacterium]|nr:DNA-binding protein [Chloroflexota bacterium]